MNCCYFAQFADKESGIWRAAWYTTTKWHNGHLTPISDFTSFDDETGCQGKPGIDLDREGQEQLWCEGRVLNGNCLLRGSFIAKVI